MDKVIIWHFIKRRGRLSVRSRLPLPVNSRVEQLRRAAAWAGWGLGTGLGYGIWESKESEVGYETVTVSVPVNPSKVLISSETPKQLWIKVGLIVSHRLFGQYVLSFQCNVTLHADA